MSTTSPTTDSGPVPTPVEPGRFAIRVIGVGGGGCNAVAHLAREPMDSVQFHALNTDAAALERCPVTAKFVIGQLLTRGLGAGGDPERGRAAAEEDRERILQLCTGAQIVFVAAGMGGGTGTGAAPVVARIAREAGALVLATVILPFDWEGGRRQRQASLGLHELKGEADAVICLPNQRMVAQIDQQTPIDESFALMNEFLAQGVRGICRLMTRPGLVNVDFADLCSVTRGRHSESVLATVAASGEHRAREVVEKLMVHPLLDAGAALADSPALLVSLVGGPDLSMADVTRVMEQVNRQAEHAHIIMGATIEPEHTGRLTVTIVASRRGSERIDPAEAGEMEGPVPNRERDLSGGLLDPNEPVRGSTRFAAPPPESTLENAQKLMQSTGARGRRRSAKVIQGQLDLQIVSKGRFEKSEPTIHQGEDLDVPTYIRKGVALN